MQQKENFLKVPYFLPFLSYKFQGIKKEQRRKALARERLESYDMQLLSGRVTA